jgi:hypothetical protein
MRSVALAVYLWRPLRSLSWVRLQLLGGGKAIGGSPKGIFNRRKTISQQCKRSTRIL